MYNVYWYKDIPPGTSVLLWGRKVGTVVAATSDSKGFADYALVEYTSWFGLRKQKWVHVYSELDKMGSPPSSAKSGYSTSRTILQ